MTNTYLAPGDVMEFTAPTGGVTSGKLSQIGSGLVVVATVTAAAGERFNGYAVGVFDLDKDTGASTGWASEGAKVYFNPTSKKVTAIASGNVLIGVGVKAAADGDATGRVRLDGAVR